MDYLIRKLRKEELILKTASRHYFSIENPRGNNVLVKLSISTGEHFGLRKRDVGVPELMHTLIWNVEIEPECFFMTTAEALEVLGPGPLKTNSWCKSNSYNWSSASGLPKLRRSMIVERFSNRWKWLSQYIEKRSIHGIHQSKP